MIKAEYQTKQDESIKKPCEDMSGTQMIQVNIQWGAIKGKMKGKMKRFPMGYLRQRKYMNITGCEYYRYAL